MSDEKKPLTPQQILNPYIKTVTSGFGKYQMIDESNAIKAFDEFSKPLLEEIAKLKKDNEHLEVSAQELCFDMLKYEEEIAKLNDNLENYKLLYENLKDSTAKIQTELQESLSEYKKVNENLNQFNTDIQNSFSYEEDVWNKALLSVKEQAKNMVQVLENYADWDDTYAHETKPLNKAAELVLDYRQKNLKE